MKKFYASEMRRPEIDSLCRRPVESLSDLLPIIRETFEAIESRGNEAIRELTLKFDRVSIDDILVSDEEFAAAEKISPASKEAIRFAASNIEKFHRAQMPAKVLKETSPGVVCRREWRPIEHVGLYVPGGKAPLVSTVLMLGIPAKIAGCAEITLCTPPDENGMILPEILFAAKHLGIKRVAKAGGAQAIAAMAIGTESIPRVEKIFGPGNRYVTAAKAFASCLAAGPLVAIDMLAGPSELLVIADESANPSWIAADLLSQAEHGPDSQVVLVSLSERLVNEVDTEIQKQILSLTDANEIRESLKLAFAVIASDRNEALYFSNAYAPEHLNLAVSDPESWVAGVKSAGSVFVGSHCSVVFGDYASGTNHTLPTAGTARATSGLTIESYLKSILFQTVADQGLTKLATESTALARIEGLEAHARAAESRIKP